MKVSMSKVVTALAVTITAVPSALAGFAVQVPEPSMLPLFAVAAVALYISKKRRK
jgi:hypothetical protein